MKRVEKGWMVAGRGGLVSLTESGAISDHVLVGLGQTWSKLYDHGDRAVEVTIAYDYPEEAQKK